MTTRWRLAEHGQRISRRERIAPTSIAMRRLRRYGSKWARSCALIASASWNVGRSYAHAGPSDMPTAHASAVAHGARNHRLHSTGSGSRMQCAGRGAGSSGVGGAGSAAPAATGIEGAAMTEWASPVPRGIGCQTRVFRPGRDVRVVADVICTRAWKGPGVRVFRWPCGTVAVVRVGSYGDEVLLRECLMHLLVTYAHRSDLGSLGQGPKLVDIVHDLNWVDA